MAQFEWDPRKAASNLRKHGVPFSSAIRVFDDPSRQEQMDTSKELGEERWLTLGRADNGILFVGSTQRQESIRLISARKATRNEQRIYWDGYIPL
jgi:uncharacterized DUF497 family protein